MYVIDSKIKIALSHVERVETNTRNQSITFELSSGRCAVKKFATQGLADAELISVEALIDALNV
jgi:hypothetical protein